MSCECITCFGVVLRIHWVFRQKVEVPEDSPEGRKWLAQQGNPSPNTISLPTHSSDPTTNLTACAPVSATPPLSHALHFPPRPLAKSSPKPAAKKGGFANLLKSAKPKKLTTLEKSKLDWQSHLASTEAIGVKDELEANRKEGVGYLEKMDFLGRVQDRVEEGRTEAGNKRKR